MVKAREDIVYVQMFGNLELRYKDIVLNSEIIRSEMVEMLLVYMLSHYRYEVLASEICEKLWDEDESDNPIGALKNLMYRLRTILKKQFKKDDFIITGRGTYRWNPDIPIEMDIEFFDECIRKSTEQKDEKNKQMLEKAVKLYKGPFLPKHTKQHWIIQQSTYYQSQYNTAVKKLADTLYFLEDYEKLETICMEALKFDNFDETLHYMLMLALMKQNKKTIAIEHYLAMTKMLYDELGIRASNEIQNLYQELLKQENSREMDLSIIQHDLDEALKPRGAFLCEYGVFKEIYRLQSRQSLRLGMSIFCALLTVNIRLNIPNNSDMYIKLMNKVVLQLQGIICRTLRVGDSASRYSASQFVILLPSCTYETSKMVMERLKKKYYAEDHGGKVELLYDVRELLYSGES